MARVALASWATVPAQTPTNIAYGSTIRCVEETKDFASDCQLLKMHSFPWGKSHVAMSVLSPLWCESGVQNGPATPCRVAPRVASLATVCVPSERQLIPVDAVRSGDIPVPCTPRPPDPMTQVSRAAHKVASQSVSVPVGHSSHVS